MNIMASCSRESSLHAVVRAGFPIGTNSNPGGGSRLSVYWIGVGQCLGSLERSMDCCESNNTSSSSFFFLSLFSMSSNHDLCPELILGFSGLATKPGGKGAVQSIKLPLRSLLCRSLACSPVPTPGAVRFSLPISTGKSSVYREGTCTQRRVSAGVRTRQEGAVSDAGSVARATPGAVRHDGRLL